MTPGSAEVKLVLGLILARHSHRGHPAASLPQFRPVLTAGGRLARLPEPRAGPSRKYPIVYLIYTNTMFLHPDLIILVMMNIKRNNTKLTLF